MMPHCIHRWLMHNNIWIVLHPSIGKGIV
jgi:hypothetical protein